MFLFLAFGLFIATAQMAMKQGPAYATRTLAIPIFLLGPAWLKMNLGSLVVDLRSAAGFGLMLGVLASGKIGRPTVSDFLAFLIFLSVTISQCLTTVVGPLTVPDAFRRWFLPYLVGRMLIESPKDWAPAAKSLGIVGGLVGGLAAVECVTGLNPWTIIFPKTFSLLMEGEGFRHGLKRGQASMEHPIFLGMSLVLMLPFAAESCRLAATSQGDRKWYLCLAGVLAGIGSTLSRGPMLVAIAGFGGWFFFRFPRFRLALIGLAVLGAVGLWAFKDQAMAALSAMGGESHNDEVRIILIDDEPTEYTGTLHRILLWRVYDEAIRSSGWFGHGVAMKTVELEESIAQRFGSIDNGYLLLFLQHGLASLLSLVLLLFWTLLRLFVVGWSGASDTTTWVGTIFGVLVGMAVILTTVWLAPDFAGLLLVTFGWTACLNSNMAEIADKGDQPQNEPAGDLSKPGKKLHSGVAPLKPLNDSPEPGISPS